MTVPYWTIFHVAELLHVNVETVHAAIFREGSRQRGVAVCSLVLGEDRDVTVKKCVLPERGVKQWLPTTEYLGNPASGRADFV